MAEKTTYDAQAARLAIEADRRERLQRAAERVQVILAEERVDIIAHPQYTDDGRTIAIVRYVARE